MSSRSRTIDRRAGTPVVGCTIVSVSIGMRYPTIHTSSSDGLPSSTGMPCVSVTTASIRRRPGLGSTCGCSSGGEAPSTARTIKVEANRIVTPQRERSIVVRIVGVDFMQGVIDLATDLQHGQCQRDGDHRAAPQPGPDSDADGGNNPDGGGGRQ